MSSRPALWLSALLLSCASTQRPVAPPPSACLGAIGDAPDGAAPARDDALRARAVAAAGSGGLCAGAVFEATRPIALYRVWHRARPHTEVGRWWSLTRPEGPRERYRADNAVCPEWSDLDVLSRCTLRAGARFVMGPGQSARCADGRELPRSAVNQVYVDNDARAGRVYVEGCEALGAWP